VFPPSFTGVLGRIPRDSGEPCVVWSSPVLVKVLYFAALRELVGKREETLHLPASVARVGALATYLESAVPALAGRMASVRLARNEQFSTPEEALAEGDVIALLPPVSGG
jgi:molybdopterin converting factor subunit 1